jgi:hypothetical protein
MKTANRILLAALFVFMVTGLAFGQTMKPRGAILNDALLVAEDDDVSYYRIPEDSEAFRPLSGDVQLGVAEGVENSADPVTMFDVLACDSGGSVFWYYKPGEKVVHELEFHLSSGATVTTNWVVSRSGTKVWEVTSTPTPLGAGYYVIKYNKTRSYQTIGTYFFKGSVLATGAKATKFNSDTFKFFVRPTP